MMIRKVSLAIAAMVGFSLGTPAFATNPMEQVGIDHNRYLECVMRSGPQGAAAPLRTLVENCGFDAGMSGDALQARYGFMVDANVGVGVIEGAQLYRDYFTDEQFAFIAGIDGILTLDADADETEAMLTALERQALAQLDAKAVGSQAVFAALSTARHSLRYWAASGHGGSAGMRFPWDIVGADLLGALGGTLIGGPIMGTAIGVACSAAAGGRDPG